MSQKYGILEITDISLSDLVFRLLLTRTCRKRVMNWFMRRFIYLPPLVVMNATNFEEGVACYFADLLHERGKSNQT